MNITGAIYFPTQLVQFNNGIANPSGCTQLIAGTDPIHRRRKFLQQLRRHGHPARSGRRNRFARVDRSIHGRGQEAVWNSPERRDESGTAAIEFGLFLPFLLLLLTGTVELGLSMYEAMQVSNAVEAGALYAAKNGFNATNIGSATTGASALPSQLNTLSATPAPTQFCGCPSAAGSISNLGPPRSWRVFRDGLLWRPGRHLCPGQRVARSHGDLSDELGHSSHIYRAGGHPDKIDDVGAEKNCWSWTDSLWVRGH